MAPACQLQLQWQFAARAAWLVFRHQAPLYRQCTVSDCQIQWQVAQTRLQYENRGQQQSAGGLFAVGQQLVDILSRFSFDAHALQHVQTVVQTGVGYIAGEFDEFAGYTKTEQQSIKPG